MTVGWRCIRLGVLCLTAGCGAGWHRVEPVPEQGYPPRQQVQVWTDGRVRVLHGVSLVGDSLLGTPYQQSLECDSCAVAVPLGQVDSVRLGNKERGFYRSLGLTFLALGIVAYVFRGVYE